MIRGILLLALVAMTCGSCLKNDKKMSETQLIYGSTIVYKGLPDPRRIVGAGDWVLADHLWARLVHLSEHGEETGYLAKNWKRSLDGLVWTFEFPENLRWSDGSTMTTKQIADSLNLSIHGTAHTSLKSYVRKIYPKDATHVVFELHTLPQNFLYSLAFTDFAITDGPVKLSTPRQLKELRTSGPYRPLSFQANQIILEPNQYAVDQPKSTLVAKIVSASTNEELFQLLRKAEVNIAVFDDDSLSNEDEQALKEAHLIRQETSPEWTVALRTGKNAFRSISNQNLRWLQRALWERLSRNTSFGVLSATGVRPPFRFGGLLENEWRELISTAPSSSKGRLKIELFVLKAFLTARSYLAVKKALLDLGIEIKETVYDFISAPNSSVIERLKNKDYDFCFMFEGVNDPDPDSAWRYMMDSYPGEKKLVTKEELDKALLEPDRKKREAMYKEFEKRNIENPYVLPIRMVGSKVFIKPPILPPEEGQFEWGIQLWKFRAK